jgi:hypothetical protein
VEGEVRSKGFEESGYLPERSLMSFEITGIGKGFKSNHFEDFLPKDWEKRAREGYEILVRIGLRPASQTFPPPLEFYKEWKQGEARK